MMTSQDVRLPLLTVERVAPSFGVSLGLRWVDTVRALVVQDFEGIAGEDADDLASEGGSLSDGKPRGK